MKAFSPIYGAIANGLFAYIPTAIVPKKAARIVAAIDASKGIPAAISIAGLTITMYAIVTKVVVPARISVLIVDLFSLILKKEYSIDFIEKKYK
jgi:hypothetical protein